MGNLPSKDFFQKDLIHLGSAGLPGGLRASTEDVIHFGLHDGSRHVSKQIQGPKGPPGPPRHCASCSYKSMHQI